MKIFFCVRTDKSGGPIQRVLKGISAHAGHTVVAYATDAELVVTDDVDIARSYLGDRDNLKVLVATLMDEREEAEAAALAQAYPGRVEQRPLLEREGEQNIVLYLMELGRQAK